MRDVTMARAVVLCVCACLAIQVGQPPAPAEEKTPSSAEEAMARVLSKPAISGPLLDAFEQFEHLVGVRLEVDSDALVGTGVALTDQVAVKVPQATGGQVLDLMLAQVARKGKPLGWYVDRDTVHVTTQMRVLYRSSLPREVAVVQPTRPQTVKRIRELVFDETPLEDAIDHLRNLSGLNFQVNWRSVGLVGVERTTPVTLKVANITLDRALSLLTDQLSTSPNRMDRVYWVLDEGVVTVAAGAALDTSMRTRVYDVADLLQVLPNFRAPRSTFFEQAEGASGSQTSTPTRFAQDTTGSDSGQQQEAGEENENLVEQRQKLRDDLVAAIKDAIGPEMWQPIGKGSIRLFGQKLIITQSLLGFKLLAEATRTR
jgi:hypothetical protein